MKTRSPETALRPIALFVLALAAMIGAAVAADGMTAAGPAILEVASSTFSPAEPWTAVSASGSVEWRAPGEAASSWQSLGRGMSLQSESVVRTGHRGRTTLTRGGSVILVDPGSEVILPASFNGADSRIHQKSGKVLYTIEKQHGARFEVETPWLVAGVKGTMFGVIMESDYSSVSVEEGVVEVVSTDLLQAFELFPGDMVVMNHGSHNMSVFRDGASRSEVGSVQDSRYAKAARKQSQSLLWQAERAGALDGGNGKFDRLLGQDRAGVAGKGKASAPGQAGTAPGDGKGNDKGSGGGPGAATDVRDETQGNSGKAKGRGSAGKKP